VNGTIRGRAILTSDWALLGYNSADTAASGLWFDNGDGELLLRDDGNNLNVRIRSDDDSYFNGGNVGIGNSPASDAKLEVWNGNLRVRGDQNNYIQLSNVAGNTKASLGNAGNEGDLSLYTSGNVKTVYLSSYYNSYINSSGGNLGIGTTSPGRELDVLGVIRAQGPFHSVVSSTSTNLATASGGQLNLFNRASRRIFSIMNPTWAPDMPNISITSSPDSWMSFRLNGNFPARISSIILSISAGSRTEFKIKGAFVIDIKVRYSLSSLSN
jgi:hypothetical protein